MYSFYLDNYILLIRFAKDIIPFDGTAPDVVNGSCFDTLGLMLQLHAGNTCSVYGVSFVTVKSLGDKNKVVGLRLTCMQQSLFWKGMFGRHQVVGFFF